MTANALIQIHIDQKVKKEAAAVLNDIGLTVSDAVRLLLTRVARDKAPPFELLTPNDATVAAMRQACTSNLDSFDSANAPMDDLHAED